MKTKNLSVKVASVATSLVMVMFPMGLIVAETAQTQNYTASVSMLSNNVFSPQSLTVQAGTTVTWRNVSNEAHTVTFNNYPVNSGPLSPGSSFSVTFNEKGVFNYYCQFHPGMTGTIIVVDGTPPPPYKNSLTATVGGQPSGGQIVVNSITPIKTTGADNNNFTDGWQWIFDVSVPLHETNLSMQFANWILSHPSTGYVMPVSNNMRFYSPQSSNAANSGSAIYITNSNIYSQSMHLIGSIGDAPPGMRRINITVETKIPFGTPSGTYNTNFGVRSQ